MNSELEEIEREIFRLKAKRRELRRQEPRRTVEDYVLLGPEGVPTPLSALFGEQSDLLVIHNMGKECVYCTLWADGLNGLLPHLESRTAVVLVSPNDPQTQADFAASRGWKIRMVSSQGSRFSRDMGFTSEAGNLHPGASAFHKDASGKIERTGSTWFGPGDDYCPPWPLFEMLADGINNWEPDYTYASNGASNT